MSLDGLQAENDKAVTQLGSMLFTRQVSGARYENLKRPWPLSGQKMEKWEEGRENKGVCVCVVSRNKAWKGTERNLTCH